MFWFHFASVGEFNTGKILIDHFINKKIPFCITIFTKKGFKIANEYFKKKKIENVELRWFPLFCPIFKNYKVLVLFESEIWPHIILISKIKRAKIILINARMPKDKIKKYKILKFFIKMIDKILTKSQEDTKNFLKIDKNLKIKTIGNLKLYQGDATENKRDENKKYIVFGSVRRKEAEDIAWVTNKLKNIIDKECIIIPRHPSREWEKISQKYDVKVVNKLGVLKNYLKQSYLAFIGGSLKKGYGGHNIVEPLSFKVPVLFGQYVGNIKEIAKMVAERKAGFMVKNKEELLEKIILLCKDRKFYNQTVENIDKVLSKGKKIFKEYLGEIEKCINDKVKKNEENIFN